MKMILTLVSSLAVFLSMGRGAQIGGVPVPRGQEDFSTVRFGRLIPVESFLERQT